MWKFIAGNLKILKLTNILITILHFSCTFHSEGAQGYMVGNDPNKHTEILDPQGKYLVEWVVNLNVKSITFSVTVETNGYVGLGLSKDGKMNGADIVIGGVYSNGQSYFSDRHAVANQLPILDSKQDWTLLSAKENQTHTSLRFSRPLDTCDSQDHPITTSKISLIWAYGERDNNIGYHYENRGMFNIHLLDPNYTPKITHDSDGAILDIDSVDKEETNVWSIKRQLVLPSNETSYICSIHRPPPLSKKHHIIGFEATFPNEESRRHVHHLLVYKCSAPVGQSQHQMFASWVNRQETCYILQLPTGQMPTDYCTETYLGWAVGGTTFFQPDQVGFPLATSPDEYYLVQVHYDNPQRTPNMNIGFRVNMVYTSKLRPNDGGILSIAEGVPGIPPSVLIPPSSTDHRIHGHCSPQCTRALFPTNGIKTYAVQLHAHNSGRKHRFRHFRNNQELPWIADDDNFAFNYQPVRHLPQIVELLPGDQLTARCVYDSVWANSTVVGGYSSRQEMCIAFIFHYEKISDRRTTCRSDIISMELRQRFLGVQNVTWTESKLEFVVDPPQRLAGLTISDVSNNHVNWNEQTKANLQAVHDFHPQISVCSRDLFAQTGAPDDIISGPVSLPTGIAEYQPPKACFTTNYSHNAKHGKSPRGRFTQI